MFRDSGTWYISTVGPYHTLVPYRPKRDAMHIYIFMVPCARTVPRVMPCNAHVHVRVGVCVCTFCRRVEMTVYCCCEEHTHVL